MTGRYLLFMALGAFLMFIILKIIASGKAYKSEATKEFIALAKTGEAYNLLRTNEFRELAKTTEFRNLVGTLAKEQVNALATALTGTVKTF